MQDHFDNSAGPEQRYRNAILAELRTQSSLLTDLKEQNSLLKDIIKLLSTPKPDPPKIVKRTPSKKTVEQRIKRGTQQ